MSQIKKAASSQTRTFLDTVTYLYAESLLRALGVIMGSCSLHLLLVHFIRGREINSAEVLSSLLFQTFLTAAIIAIIKFKNHRKAAADRRAQAGVEQ